MKIFTIYFEKPTEMDVCINHTFICEVIGTNYFITKDEGKYKLVVETFTRDNNLSAVFTSEPFDHFTYHEEAQTINLEMYQEVAMLEVVLFLGLGLLVSLFALIK